MNYFEPKRVDWSSPLDKIAPPALGTLKAVERIVVLGMNPCYSMSFTSVLQASCAAISARFISDFALRIMLGEMAEPHKPASGGPSFVAREASSVPKESKCARWLSELRAKRKQWLSDLRTKREESLAASKAKREQWLSELKVKREQSLSGRLSNEDDAKSPETERRQWLEAMLSNKDDCDDDLYS